MNKTNNINIDSLNIGNLTVIKSIPVSIIKESNGRYIGTIPGLDEIYIKVYGETETEVIIELTNKLEILIKEIQDVLTKASNWDMSCYQYLKKYVDFTK